MKILVLNAGSSSCKYKLFNMDDHSVLCQGLVERIGDPTTGCLTHKIAPDTAKEEKISLEEPFKDHAVALNKVIELLTDAKKGVIKDTKEISVIGHRVLHGGYYQTQPALVDEACKKTIRDAFPLGPLHNPPNYTGIEVAEKLFPGVPNVAVFDTAFGMQMPEEAYTYALPKDLCKELQIRRYGFHGTSHTYLTHRGAAFMHKPLEEFNCITLHLGNGSSLGCVKNGKCIDTSMGLTPLEGVVMGTRCGSIDPAIVPYIMDQKGLSAKEVDTIMNKKSGLLGLCGQTDLRDMHRLADQENNADAILARKILIRSFKKQLGSFFFLLEGHVDCLIFSAGIGENDAKVRAGVVAGLESVGICLDKAKNETRSGDERDISTADSRVKVLVIPTNEELQIALTAQDVLAKSKKA
ncbi:MAG: acetate kinase [Desulfovibrionaceae bacterium]|nr:acetate kinase [Desulfovibrionaceae bacterium]